MTASSHKGMTLIEVITALAILAIGLAGALSTVIYAAKFQGTASHVQEASALAQSLLSGLLSVPYSARGSGASGGTNTLFTNGVTANDADIADVANNFSQATLPANSYDHVDTEIAGTPLAAMVSPLPTGRTRYERYWNLAPLPSGTGVAIAVIVRWSEAGTWRRTVVVGTRYSP